jgi:hypothetical protein
MHGVQLKIKWIALKWNLALELLNYRDLKGKNIWQVCMKQKKI